MGHPISASEIARALRSSRRSVSRVRTYVLLLLLLLLLLQQ